MILNAFNLMNVQKVETLMNLYQHCQIYEVEKENILRKPFDWEVTLRVNIALNMPCMMS